MVFVDLSNATREVVLLFANMTGFDDVEQCVKLFPVINALRSELMESSASGPDMTVFFRKSISVWHLNFSLLLANASVQNGEEILIKLLTSSI